MGISVMSWSFSNVLRTGQMDTAVVVRYVRELGVEAVELMDSFIRDDQRGAVRDALKATGCTHVCYDVGGDFVTPDRSSRRAAVDQVVAGLERGAYLGARRALVVPGTLKSSVSPAVARNWIVEGLRACVPEATRLGLELTIEDHSSQAAVYGRSAHLTYICDSVGPQLAVTYDVGNFLLAGEDPLDAVEPLGSRIVHAHYKDWRLVTPSDQPPDRSVAGVDGRRYTGAVLGEGLADLPGAASRLRSRGYDGYVSVEYEGVGDPRQAVRRGVDCVRALLGSTPGGGWDA
jgi:sugar phosphate isomerase/epimerase